MRGMMVVTETMGGRGQWASGRLSAKFVRAVQWAKCRLAVFVARPKGELWKWKNVTNT